MTDRADVLVIGGGIVGVAVAHAVAAQGATVVLLERDKIASGTTGASFAWLNATAKADDEPYHRLNAGGVRRHFELAADWGEEVLGIAGSGSLHWTHPAADGPTVDRLLERARRLSDWGYPVVQLERRELRALEPYIDFPDGSVGFLAPLDRWLDAPRFTRRLADEARALGADIREGAAVTGFVFDRDRVVGAESSPHRIVADTVVLAAGTALPTLIAMARRSLERVVPVHPVPGLLVDTPALERTWLRHVVYFPDGNGFHMRPTFAGGVSLGADDIDEAHGRAADLTTGATALLHRASSFLPGFPTLELVAAADARIGVRPMPEDGLPVVGRLPDVANVYVVATHSGITLAPHLGALAAREIVAGEPQAVLAPYRPARFSD
jgi:glycine/D-amino acid oxidase-like deaminating enzyme